MFVSFSRLGIGKTHKERRKAAKAEKEKLAILSKSGDGKSCDKIICQSGDNCSDASVKSCDKSSDQLEKRSCSSHCQCTTDIEKLTLNSKPDMSKLNF